MSGHINSGPNEGIFFVDSNGSLFLALQVQADDDPRRIPFEITMVTTNTISFGKQFIRIVIPI